MVAAFLHGVETISLSAGPRPIRQVKSGIIGLIGTAPIHHVPNAPELHAPTLIASDLDAPKFGPRVAGYSIPGALAAVFRAAGPAIVINVFDPATHKKDVAAASEPITDGKITLPHGDLISVTVTTEADAACDEGVDYTVDRVTGTLGVVAGGKLASEATAKVGYSYGDPSLVTAADIIGAVTAAGVRQGAQAFLNAASLLGMKPKILIAPGFSSDRQVADALLALAGPKKLRAVVLADVPAGASRDDVLQGRGPGGDIDLGISSNRLFYCYPHLKPSRDAVEPYSQWLAGVIAKTDAERGYWFSPSNKVLEGIVGTELPLTAEYSDENCDTNLLNGAGIVTAFAGYGAGVKTWGNRASSFPASQDVETFMAVTRTRDMIEEAIETYSAGRADEPITKTWIDAVLADVNEFIRTLIGRGACAPGSAATFIPEKNPASEIAAGRVTFTNRFAPPTPAEHIIWESIIDTTLLAQS